MEVRWSNRENAIELLVEPRTGSGTLQAAAARGGRWYALAPYPDLNCRVLHALNSLAAALGSHQTPGMCLSEVGRPAFATLPVNLCTCAGHASLQAPSHAAQHILTPSPLQAV